MNTIKIRIGDLGKYNEGTLVGEWLSLPMDADELQAKINQYSRDGQGDYFIAGYESDFPISQQSELMSLNELARKLDELQEHDVKRLIYLLGDGMPVGEALENYDDVIFYEGMKLTDVAQELVEEGCFGDIPESIANYIDYKSIARDLRLDGYEETSEGVFFRN